MLVIFQDKIIYMPSVPPFARRETIAQYQKSCGRIMWREEELKSSDGTGLALCISEHTAANNPSDTTQRVIILYFQGQVLPNPRELALTRVVTHHHFHRGCLDFLGSWRQSPAPGQMTESLARLSRFLIAVSGSQQVDPRRLVSKRMQLLR